MKIYTLTEIEDKHIGKKGTKERDEYDVGSEKHDRRRIQYSSHPLRSAGRHVCKNRGTRECTAQQ